ncbi:MAG: hypothetical protein AB1700_04140 [Bacillota bacterium]
MWYFRVRGCFYPIGPIEAASKSTARRKANRMGFKSVAEVWETTREEMESIAKQNQRQINEFRAAGKGTEAFMVADI